MANKAWGSYSQNHKIVSFMKWLTIFSFLGCGNKSASELKTLEHGPFTIQMETVTTKSFNMNAGRRVANKHISYKVLYKGVSVEFPGSLQSNTGYTHLWKVYILQNAKQPSLIAGSQSLFLITEMYNKAVVIPLHEQGSNFASLQFLDAKDGQPAPISNVYMDQEVANVPILEGGDYLLINGHSVLYIPDSKIYSFNINNGSVDNYGFPGLDGAIAFSPDKKWIVFSGFFQIWASNEVPEHSNALIIYNYMDDTGYSLPIDQTKTRLKDITYIKREWLNTYFEWQFDDAGNPELKTKKLAKLPYWQGRYIDNGTVFELSPVDEKMQQLAADYILKKLNLNKDAIVENEPYAENHINIVSGELKFTLWYISNEKRLIIMKNVYSPENSNYNPMIKMIGDSFNQELNMGKYQEYFTSF